MVDEFKRGDRVEWKFGRGKAVGAVRRKLTSRLTVGSRIVAASKDDPRYLVETEKSKKQAAKRPGVIPGSVLFASLYERQGQAYEALNG